MWYGDKFIVGALFDDGTSVENVDTVGVANCGETVGDDNGGAIF